MSKKWRLTDRTRMLLTLELAMVLPAAALMGFSIMNLKHIQRDQAIEAAIQRDFSYVLKIGEKATWKKAIDLLAPVRKEFPNPDDSDSKITMRLGEILKEHPEYAYAILYDKKNNRFLTRMQPGHEHDEIFCARTEEEFKAMASWLPVEATTMAEKLRRMALKEEVPVNFEGGWSGHDNHQTYWNIASFIPPGVPESRVALGIVAFDNEYLRNTFLP